MKLFFQDTRRALKGPGLPDDLGSLAKGGWGSELSDYAGKAGLLLLLLLQRLLRLPPRQDYSQTVRLHNHEVKDDCSTEADVTTVEADYGLWTMDKHIEYSVVIVKC